MSTIAKRTVSLPHEHAAYIDRLVASGSFASASEVVRAGLRALQERRVVLGCGGWLSVRVRGRLLRLGVSK